MGKTPIGYIPKYSKESMRCLRCKSLRTFGFIDGFGQRRIFCKNCLGSFLEGRVKEMEAQKNLHEFNIDLYHKLGFHH